MFLNVKNGTETKKYECKTTHSGTPFLRVSSEFLDLTTAMTSGLQLKVKVNNQVYRPLQSTTTSRSTGQTLTTGYSGYLRGWNADYTETTGYSGMSKKTTGTATSYTIKGSKYTNSSRITNYANGTVSNWSGQTSTTGSAVSSKNAYYSSYSNSGGYNQDNDAFLHYSVTYITMYNAAAGSTTYPLTGVYLTSAVNAGNMSNVTALTKSVAGGSYRYRTTSTASGNMSSITELTTSGSTSSSMTTEV